MDVSEKDNGGSILSLLKGEITGEVRNPLTGNTISRKDLMPLYLELASEQENTDKEMLGRVKRLLEIPDDIHRMLIDEIKQTPSIISDLNVKPFIRSEMESAPPVERTDTPSDGEDTSPLSTGTEVQNLEESKSGIFDSYEGMFDDESMVEHTEILETEKGSLMDQMETDEVDLGQDSIFFSDHKDKKRSKFLLKNNP